MAEERSQNASTASDQKNNPGECPVDSSSSATPTTAVPPALSPAEFKLYNGMADHMEYFHNSFRSTWTIMETTCDTSKRPQGMSLRQFITLGLEFCHHLTLHHNIEERHIFPLLARKMPAFKKEMEMRTQHKQIHRGLEKLEEYLEACRSGERELRLSEMKDIMDGFGEVLWQHLEDEVKQLGAENMRKYWTLREMQMMPM